MPLLALIGACIAGAGAIPYLQLILQEKVRPTAVTWLVWSFQAALMSWALARVGAQASVFLCVSFLVFRLIIFFAALRQRSDGHGGLGRLSLFPEKVCLAAALFAGCWLLVSEHETFPLLLLLSIDVIGFLPTAVRVYQEPGRESPLPWAISITGAAVTIAGVIGSPPVDYVFPVWAFLNGTIVLAARALGRRRSPRER